MGYSRHLFLEGERIGEFECDICYDVMKDPIMCEGCEHVFCTSCIQTWMSTSNTCPACRGNITGLQAPCRPYLNLYASLKLRCCFDGCGQIFDLGRIEQHTKSCEHNPNAFKVCMGSCGGLIKMKDIPTHDCREYLKLKIFELEEELKLKTAQANIYLEYLGRKYNQINRMRAGYLQIIRSKDKERSDILERLSAGIENIKKEHVEVIRSKDELFEDLQKINIVLAITAAIIIFSIIVLWKSYN